MYTTELSTIKFLLNPYLQEKKSVLSNLYTRLQSIKRKRNGTNLKYTQEIQNTGGLIVFGF